jgi:hypothetical protein
MVNLDFCDVQNYTSITRMQANAHRNNASCNIALRWSRSAAALDSAWFRLFSPRSV